MRVAHIVPTLAVADGGPAETLKRLVPALRARGIECSVVTTDKGGRSEDPHLLNAVVKKAFPPASLTLSPGLVRAVWRATDQTDVVHAHGYPTFPTSVALRVASRRRIPVLLQPHGAFDEYQWTKNVRRKKSYASCVDGGIPWRQSLPVLVSSGLEARGVQRILPGANLYTCPLGVDDALFHVGEARVTGETGRSGERCHVVFLGRVTRKKRLDVLLAALARMAPALGGVGVEVTVAGPIEPGLGYDPVRTASLLPPNVSVRFLGRVGPLRRASLLAAADIFVLPSEDESFGIAAAEAMAAGCVAVLTSEVGLAPEAAASGACVLTTRDPEHLAQLLFDLIGDVRRRRDIAARGFAHAQRSFRWARVAERLAAIYTEVSSGNAPVRLLGD